MGRKPPSPYSSSHVCWWFEEIYNMPTPDIVCLTLSGVESCAGPFTTDPNGIHLLPNTAFNPCLWSIEYAEWIIDCSIGPGISLLVRLVGMPANWAYIGEGLVGSTFPNIAVCPGHLGHRGTGIISWGPPPN